MSAPSLKLAALSRCALSEAASQERTELIIERVRLAGIEGLGGGRFPTAKKIAEARNAKTLVVNGLQSEPDNQSDIALLREHPATTLAGASLVASACGVSTIALALPTGLDKTLCVDTQKALQEELDWLNHFSSHQCNARQVYLPSDHATGQEHQLASTLGLINKPTKAVLATPLAQLGVLCLNLATCFAIARAVYHAEPLTRRMITVNGRAQWIKFGTPVTDVLTPAWINGRQGGNPAGFPPLLVDGSVFCITDPPPHPSAPCINCGACRPVCPVDLMPDEIHHAMSRSNNPPSRALEACIECGACNAACPSGLWLTQEFREAKKVQDQAQTRERAAAKAKARVQAREARLEAIKLQREDRLRARSTAPDGTKRAW